jgi:hypothetical protein
MRISTGFGEEAAMSNRPTALWVIAFFAATFSYSALAQTNPNGWIQTPQTVDCNSFPLEAAGRNVCKLGLRLYNNGGGSYYSWIRHVHVRPVTQSVVAAGAAAW